MSEPRDATLIANLRAAVKAHQAAHLLMIEAHKAFKEAEAGVHATSDAIEDAQRAICQATE